MGSRRPSCDGVHPAPTEAAARVGTIIITEVLSGPIEPQITRGKQVPELDLQSDPIIFGNPWRPNFENGRKGADAAATESGEQR